jgi:hypothetical protein
VGIKLVESRDFRSAAQQFRSSSRHDLGHSS